MNYHEQVAKTVLATSIYKLPKCTFEQKRTMPNKAAIYFVFRRGKMIYIGCTVNLFRRWRQQHQLQFFPNKTFNSDVIRWFILKGRQVLNRMDYEKAFQVRYNAPLSTGWGSRDGVMYQCWHRTFCELLCVCPACGKSYSYKKP